MMGMKIKDKTMAEGWILQVRSLNIKALYQTLSNALDMSSAIVKDSQKCRTAYDQGQEKREGRSL